MSDNSSAQVAVADSGLFPDSTKPCMLIAFAFKCLFHCRLNECVVISNVVFLSEVFCREFNSFFIMLFLFVIYCSPWSVECDSFILVGRARCAVLVLVSRPAVKVLILWRFCSWSWYQTLRTWSWSWVLY